MPKLSILRKPCSSGNQSKRKKKQKLSITNDCIQSKNRISMPEDRESRKQNAILIQKAYSIEAPSTEDNHTVKSPPQAACFTSDTRQRTGDDSISVQVKLKKIKLSFSTSLKQSLLLTNKSTTGRSTKFYTTYQSHFVGGTIYSSEL